jgi:tetratricopeptide (TPR) repeat protein
VVLKVFKTLWPYLLITLLIVVVYGKVTSFEYTWFDDNRLILKSYPFISKISNIPNSFLQDANISSGYFSNYYRPIAIVSFILDSARCQTFAYCYHTTNLILHIIAVWVLFVFLQRLMIKKSIAFILSALFAVHPALISTVAWIPGRNDLLVTIFFLIGFIFFDIYISKQKNKYLILHNVFFHLALYSKEVSLLLPVLLFLYYKVLLNNNFFVNKKRVLIFIWGVEVLIWITLRQLSVHNYYATLFDQIKLSYLPGIFSYFEKILPVNLSVWPTLHNFNIALGLFLLVILTVLAYKSAKKSKIVILGFVWFVTMSVLSITQSESTTEPLFLEQRLYIAIVGVVIMFGCILSLKYFSRALKLIVGASILVVIIFSVFSVKRLDYYKNGLTFWTQATLESPDSARAFQSLGFMYQNFEGKPDRAIELYRHSLYLDSKVPLAHANLGIIYLDKGQYQLAENELKSELDIRVNDYALLHLGRVYYSEGNKKSALETWQKAYAISPSYLPVVINLALVNAELGNHQAAKDFYTKAVDLGGLEGSDRVWLEKVKFLENIE